MEAYPRKFKKSRKIDILAKIFIRSEIERNWAVSNLNFRSYIDIPVLFVHCIPKIAIFFFEVFFKSQIHLLLFLE